MEATRQVHIPHYKGLLLRKTYPQCAELIDKSLTYYKQAYPDAKYNGSNHTWTFPSGAKIVFGSMQHTKDRINYQGQAYDFIGFDELTHFLWDEYSYLFSRCRPNGPGTECYIRATANPGSIGHAWVKERFITAGKPLETIWEELKWVTPDGKEHIGKRSRVFVPSSVFDNPILLQNDPSYIQSLAALPEAERNALLYGDWDSFSGQVFMEWRNNPDHYEDRIGTHVIKPFKIPQDWAIWCGFDWGYSRPFSVCWFAVDHDRRLYAIREYYGCTGSPNVGVQMDASEIALHIREIEEQDVNLKGRKINRVGDPAIWAKNGHESIGDLMERQGVCFAKGNNERINGKMQMHHRLAFDENGIPLLYVFDTCKHFIRTIPALVYDEKDVEDINTDGEDHVYDCSRYVLMENPIAPPEKKKPEPKPYNPLDDDVSIKEYGRYDFYKIY